MGPFPSDTDPMPKNSRAKGAQGEREAAAAFERATGFPAHRTAQRVGVHGDADIQTTVPIHLESKRVARIGAIRYLEQAERDAREDSVPAVLMRQDRDTEWVVMVRLRDIARFADIIHDGRNRPCL